MSRLNQESSVESITRTGVIEDADVRLDFTRENGNTVRQITVNASKASENGTSVSVYLEWQRASRNITMVAYGCELNAVPIELIVQFLSEMQLV